MYNSNVNRAFVKIIGLLGEFDGKQILEFPKELLNDGFSEDCGPLSYKNYDSLTKDKREKHLKDVFYPDFRELLFANSSIAKIKREEVLSRRFFKSYESELFFIELDVKNKEIIKQSLNFKVVKSEIFLFAEQIGLFALTLELCSDKLTDESIRDLIFFSRNFDSLISVDGSNKTQLWHNYISETFISKIKLVGENVKADEYSGSKFKTYTVIDSDVAQENRSAYLYDMGTASKIGSARGTLYSSPHPDYYTDLMKNKISIFNNWEALCLFDSFTCAGHKLLLGKDEEDEFFKKSNWEYIYFRVYLFRLFFKYNLYRYNSDLHDNTVKLRNQFEKFLNNYNLSHISFNFLPNEMFNKIGEALHLDEELVTFQSRINRISSAIQEEKQSRTNALLQFVTVLGGLGSVQPVFEGLSLAQKYLGWSNGVFYTLLVLILLGITLGVLAFLMPDLVKTIKKNIFNKKSNL
jgi:hypothetical protein